jgi:uncharacterized glyoxalase superfamily protein PhnB
MSGMARLFCYYSYRNASHAIDWLIQAFGFERVCQQDGANGTVAHAELRLGDVGLPPRAAPYRNELGRQTATPDGQFAPERCRVATCSDSA